MIDCQGNLASIVAVSSALTCGAGMVHADDVDLTPGTLACVERLLSEDIEPRAGWQGGEIQHTAGGNEISVLRSRRHNQRIYIRNGGSGFGSFRCWAGTTSDAAPVLPEWLERAVAVEIAGVRFDPDRQIGRRLVGCVNGWTVEIVKVDDGGRDEVLVQFTSPLARVSEPGGDC